MKKLIIFSLIFSLIPFTALADGAALPKVEILLGDNAQTPDGTVWHISQGGKAAYPSQAVFSSYRFNTLSTVKKISLDQLKNIPSVPDVAPQDGKVYCPSQGLNAGTCFLLSQGQKYAFTSFEVLQAQGYIVTQTTGLNLDAIPTGGHIEKANEAHKPGSFINNDGIVQLITPDSRFNISNLTIFYSWGYSFLDVVKANREDLLIPERGNLSLRKAGELNPLIRIEPKFGAIGSSNIASSATTPSTTLISSVTQNTEPTVFGSLQFLPKSTIVKSPHSPQVWFITSRGYKKPIPSVEVLESYQNSLSQVETISQEVLDNYLPVQCVKIFNDSTTYQLVAKGKKRLTITQISSLCPFPEQVLEINTFELNAYPNIK